MPVPPAGPRIRNPTCPAQPRLDPLLMRFVLTLTTIACLTPFALAAATDEAKERGRLEKAEARVTIDDGMPDVARLRVSFAKLDDKAATALKGCTHVAALAVEDA